MRPLISICILAGHGPKMLAACLEGLRGQVDAPAFELLVGAGRDDREPALVRTYFPEARVVMRRKGHPGFARNDLIREARGELLLFLDDDVTVASDLLKQLAELADRYPSISVFGGPNDTPPGSSRFQAVQGAVLSSVVGSGPVSRRYGARHPGPADERWFTLCNLAVRRSVMVPFVDHLVCAEENALLAQLRAQGEEMRYEPRLRVFHSRRPTWRAFAQQMFKYGYGRGQVLMRDPATTRAAFLTPSALLVYVAALPLWLALVPSPAALGPLAIYAVVIGAGALRVAITMRDRRATPLAAGLLLTVHACYGIGVLRGLIKRGPDGWPPLAWWRESRDEAPAPDAGAWPGRTEEVPASDRAR